MEKSGNTEVKEIFCERAASFLEAFYKSLKPVLGSGNCRFHPTCSEYSFSAIRKYGFLKGGILSVKRLSKCHPFHRGGYDPLP